MRSLGHQIVAEFYSCDKELLNDVDYIRNNMLEAAIKSGATIVTETFHHFSPHGVSGAVIIAESHLAIHTWPEYGYAAVDLFTCGDSVSAETGFNHLRGALKSSHVSTMEIHRGQVDLMQVRERVGHAANMGKPMKLVKVKKASRA
ncbi:MAG TPA: adenosylmethionine decarboxylase [Acidiferrobacterales bacterium]|nr:adenosylmethionine decarboxylase [Acidiferrobacterales bacterium]